MIYRLTEEGGSVIDKSIETMDEWLTNMGDDVLTAFHRICNKNTDDRSDEESYEIYKHSLVLYCRELGITELSISNDLLFNIGESFCANIIFESLRRRGLAKSNGPLLLYKDCSIELTEKGRNFIKKESGKKDK